MVYIFYLLSITMVIYSGFLLFLIIGNNFTDKNEVISDFPSVSVIIAIRNGKKSIYNLISDLSNQKYSGDVEFILVDDESDDITCEAIKEVAKKDSRFIYESSKNGDLALQMKKRALDAGINQAKSEWLLFTDVDCRLQPEWVAGMANYFNKKNDYIIGYSSVNWGKTFLNMFQAIDFFLLLIAARGASNLGYPLACTGQNQAYRKSLYKQVGGFSKIYNQRQGDDSLFLNICKKWGKASIVYADDYNCHVLSRQERTWGSLLNQRLRWSGDANIMWKVNIKFYILMVAIFLLHIILILLLVISILEHSYFPIFIKFMMIKFIMEFLLYFSGISQLNKPIYLRGFIVWYFIHIPYIALMGLGSFFQSRLNWKGRRLQALF